MQQLLVDNYRRRFQYLRLSITELCNFRCQYCLPDGYKPLTDGIQGSARFLNINEIANVIGAFTELGVHKVRLTGGEPTLRRDFNDIVALIASHAPITELAVTTNGARVFNHVKQWHESGLTAINISVDSFSPERFRLITGQNRLHEIIKGVERSLEVGIKKVKINTVLMKGLTSNLPEYLDWIKLRPVDLRFIELMETGEGGHHFKHLHLSGHSIETQLINQGWQLQAKQALAGPAKVYEHADYQGRIGLIMPYSKNFCQSCNRLRISSTGKLHYCLFGESALDLRSLLQSEQQKAELKANIIASLKIKPETHYLHEHRAGLTQNLSYIGG